MAKKSKAKRAEEALKEQNKKAAAAEAEEVKAQKEDEKPQANRKQIRDAAKKKARKKMLVLKVVIITVVSLLLVAAIGAAMFFSVYDPLGDNLKSSMQAVFNMPYEESGSDDIKSDSAMFPLYQASYFYFLNNYSDVMSEECCYTIKDYVEYWNVWNKQTEYQTEVGDFAYQVKGDDYGYFQFVLDVKNSEGVYVGAMTMSGSFEFDETNIITDITINTSKLLELDELYQTCVLGVINEDSTESETAE